MKTLILPLLFVLVFTANAQTKVPKDTAKTRTVAIKDLIVDFQSEANARMKNMLASTDGQAYLSALANLDLLRTLAQAQDSVKWPIQPIGGSNAKANPEGKKE